MHSLPSIDPKTDPIPPPKALQNQASSPMNHPNVARKPSLSELFDKYSENASRNHAENGKEKLWLLFSM